MRHGIEKPPGLSPGGIKFVVEIRGFEPLTS